jgi:hypothetical protein
MSKNKNASKKNASNNVNVMTREEKIAHAEKIAALIENNEIDKAVSLKASQSTSQSTSQSDETLKLTQSAARVEKEKVKSSTLYVQSNLQRTCFKESRAHVMDDLIANSTSKGITFDELLACKRKESAIRAHLNTLQRTNRIFRIKSDFTNHISRYYDAKYREAVMNEIRAFKDSHK